MLQKRRSEIIAKVKLHRMVKVSDLVEEYGVSIETIRRDLEYLESAGYLRRVYGGAVAVGLYGKELGYSYREVANYEEKRAIGVRAAGLIEDGDTVFFDVGVTTLEVARNLRDRKDLIIITNSTKVAGEMISQENSRVILLGGEMRAGELSVSGHLTTENLQQFYANKLVMGVGAVSLQNGFTDYHIAEANTRRSMIERADQIIAVADSSKFGMTAMNFVCPLSRVEKLVTDWCIPKEIQQEFRENGTDLLIANKR